MSDNIKKLYNEHLKELKKDYPKLNLILFENQHHKKIDKQEQQNKMYEGIGK